MQSEEGGSLHQFGSLQALLPLASALKSVPCEIVLKGMPASRAACSSLSGQFDGVEYNADDILCIEIESRDLEWRIEK